MAHRHGHTRAALALGLAGTIFAGAATAAEPGMVDGKPEKGSFSVQYENDIFFDRDADYTNGVQFAYTTAPGSTPDWAVDLVRALPIFAPDGEVRTTFLFGQDMFTPRDTTTPAPLPGDRPYAGFLYGAMGFLSKTDTTMDQLQVTLGVIGPASLANDTQKFVHSAMGIRKPAGWNTQLRDEPGLVVSYEKSWKVIEPRSVLGLFFDVVPHAGLTVGNVYDFANLGALARLGINLPDDYGPLRMQPSVPGSNFFEPNGQLSLYVFAGVDGRAIARNIFLDGNSFERSYRVSKHNLVADFQVGAAVALEDWRLSFTHVFRTSEYAGQRGTTEFGAVNLTYRF